MKLNSGMFVAVLASLLLLPMPSAASQSNTSKTLWRIGVFKAPSWEFRSQDIDYADPKGDPVYVVGKSSDRDWLCFQPGGVFRLHLAVLYETPRLSHLRVAGSQCRRRNR